MSADTKQFLSGWMQVGVVFLMGMLLFYRYMATLP
jgi:hypothetical protein